MKDTSPAFSFTEEVRQFPLEKGWYYVPLPDDLHEVVKPFANRGLTKISAKVGTTEFFTSTMPLGKNLGHDGGSFIALSAQVRKKENIRLGDKITVYFSILET